MSFVKKINSVLWLFCWLLDGPASYMVVSSVQLFSFYTKLLVTFQGVVFNGAKEVENGEDFYNLTVFYSKFKAHLVQDNHSVLEVLE